MKKNILIGGLATLGLASCTTAIRTHKINSKSGTQTQGFVRLTQKGKTVEIDLSVYKLKPNGFHAAHIHEFGNCSDTEAKNAGGHWNPTKEKHGKWGHNEFHKGDLGNLKADAEGKARMVIASDEWCIECDDESKNIVGKSIVIHSGADDFKTQPTGNAGGRIGCIEIK